MPYFWCCRFFASAVLWMLLEAEFLALVLIFVYVGAVMTLFLFVIMMLNLGTIGSREGFVRYLPFGAIVMAVLIGIMFYLLGPTHFAMAQHTIDVAHPASYSNVKELGGVLYTHYMYPFEIAAILLLVSIVSAISLAHRGRQNSKGQVISEQLSRRREDRVRLTDIKVGDA